MRIICKCHIIHTILIYQRINGAISFSSRSDRFDETFSETKIRLDDDEGYEDGQGILFRISVTDSMSQKLKFQVSPEMRICQHFRWQHRFEIQFEFIEEQHISIIKYCHSQF